MSEQQSIPDRRSHLGIGKVSASRMSTSRRTVHAVDHGHLTEF